MKLKVSTLFTLFFFFAPSVYAADSYRWLHVTIETPYAIFLFLLPMVLLPALLMAFLYWRVALKRAKQSQDKLNSESKIRSDTL